MRLTSRNTPRWRGAGQGAGEAGCKMTVGRSPEDGTNMSGQSSRSLTRKSARPGRTPGGYCDVAGPVRKDSRMASYKRVEQFKP